MSLFLAWLVECIPTHIVTLTGKILVIQFDEKKSFWTAGAACYPTK